MMTKPFQSAFEAWMNAVNENKHSQPTIRAFNFGIFEGENGYVVYLIGSETFDPDDPDWTCQVDFEPEEKYLVLEESSDMHWTEIQTLVEALIRNVLETHPDMPLFADNQAITVGFDDGDLVRLR